MRKRFAVVMGAAILGAAVFAATALGWTDYYVQNATYSPGSEATSGYNTSIARNIVYFDNRYGGNPFLGTTYVNSGGSLYTYLWWNSGYHEDTRAGWSYGASRCRASGDNNYQLYITYCYTDN